MSDFRFQNSEYLWLLLAVPFIALLFQWTIHWGEAKLTRFARWSSLRALIRGASDTAFGARVLLLSLGAAFAISALARPQANPTVEKHETSGLDILVLLDVSRSMDAEDVYPSRLGRAKKAIEQMMDQLSGDRIGVVAFAGSAVVAVPLTGDYETADLFLQSVGADLIDNQGTDFAHAVHVGLQTLERGGASAASDRARIIVVLSDGEFQLSGWDSAVKEAKEKGATLFTIAYGTARGAPIPVRDARGELVGHKKDSSGNVVVTKADEENLKKVAADGGGAFYYSTMDGSEVKDIVNRSKSFRRGALGTGVSMVYEEFYQYFLGVALFCLFLAFLPKNRKWQLWPLAIAAIFFASPARADSIFYSHEKNKSNQALELLKQGKADAAADLYRELQVEHPDSPELNYNLGTSLATSENKDEARRILGSLKGTPFEYLGKMNAAGAFAEENKIPEAKAAYAQMIRELEKNPSRTADQEKLLMDAKKRLEYLAQENSNGKSNQQKQQQNQQQQKQPQNQNSKDSSGSSSENKEKEKTEQNNQQQQQGQGQASPEEEKARKKREANDRQSMSESEADRILETLNNDESQIEKKFLKKKVEKGKVSNNEKDW